MKKITLCSALALFLAGILAAADTAEAGRLTVEITPGEHYSHRKWFGIFPVKLTPTMAVWIEDEGGCFAGTLFVTRKAAEGKWTGGKNVERPEALPVYFHRLRTASEKPDSLSGATPNASEDIRLGSNLSLPAGTWRVFAEVNSSFDYNETYPKESSGVNGQPSVVYGGTLIRGTGPANAGLRPLGTSDAAGRNGEVTADLRGLTTALSIVERITVHTPD